MKRISIIADYAPIPYSATFAALNGSMDSIGFIINSQKRKLGPFQKRILECFADSYRVEFLLTQGYRSAEHLAYTAVEQGCRYVIAVGGDGTVNEVINGVMHLPTQLRESVVVGVLPWGTGNDFARTIGAKSSVSNLLRQIEHRQYGLIDVISVSYTNGRGDIVDRYCNNIADVGIGPYTILSVDRFSRWVGSNLAFSIAAFKALVFLKSRRIRLKADGTRYTGKVKCVCMANGRYFGSGLGIAPLAMINDGLMNLVVIENVSPFLFLKFLGSLRAAKPIIHPKVHYYTAKQATITAPIRTLPLDLDGEVLGYAPITAEVIPASIHVLGDTFLRE